MGDSFVVLYVTWGRKEEGVYKFVGFDIDQTEIVSERLIELEDKSSEENNDYYLHVISTLNYDIIIEVTANEKDYDKLIKWFEDNNMIVSDCYSDVVARLDGYTHI